MEKKRSWIIAISFVMFLIIGAAIARKVASIMMMYSQKPPNYLISPAEGVIIQVVENMIICLLGFLGIAIPLGMKNAEILSLSWKILVMAATLAVYFKIIHIV